ncbi:MAG: hypothetical protein ACP5NQ_09910, partial [Vulcanisaeta sp.]
MSRVVSVNGGIVCIKYDLICGRGVDALCTDYTKAPTRDNINLVEVKGKKLLNALMNIERTLGRDPSTNCGLGVKAKRAFILHDENAFRSMQYDELKIQLTKRYSVEIYEVPIS